jgi:hypothetical protein
LTNLRRDAGAGRLLVAYTENKRPDGLVARTGKSEFKLNPKRRHG